MFPLLSISIVVFIFSLSQTTRTQDGHLPRPSIFAVPGHAHALPRGISVVIACRSPVGFERFRLEKEHLRIIDVINSSSSKTAARFYLGTMSKDTAGHYSCLYNIRNSWSPRSETLELKVIREDITEASPPVSDMTSAPTLQSYEVWNVVRMALAGVVLVVLGAIIGEAWHNQRKSTDSSRTTSGHNQRD